MKLFIGPLQDAKCVSKAVEKKKKNAFTCRYGHAPLTHIRNSTGPQS